ncbi:MAG: class I SAM-dependent methyltransferase [Acidobacteria bacterium]|nr:class I SAM-dependent methyltransferase [Acidobacteriota bacterium]MBV9474879.1 class I SAM-dependent methyltransferase [Acidobacteriota bacterium]
MAGTWWGTQTEMFGPRNAHRVGLMFRELRELSPNSLVLEAAVGLGDVAERLRRGGHRVIGADLSLDVLLGARTRSSAPLVLADVTRLPFRDAAFDCVTSAETLEHVPDDGAAAGEFARVLKNGGALIVTVPALEALRTFSDTYYEHLRRYTRAQLVRLVASRGFVVKRADYWGFPFVVAYDYLFMLPLNLRRARRPVQSDAGLRAVATAGRMRGLVRAVAGLFATDQWFRWLPIGVGLVLTARKKT